MSVETIEGAWPVVKAAGEIDLSNIEELRSALDAAIARSPDAVTVDFAEISYIDSAGVAVVISAYRKLRRADGALGIVRPTSPAARRVLELVGLQSLPGVVIADDLTTVQQGLAERQVKPAL